MFRRYVVLLLLAGCGDGERDAVEKPSGALVDAAFEAGASDAATGGAGGAGGTGGSVNDAGGGPPFLGPDKLSQTGLYLDIISRTLGPSVMPYDVRFPLWSDGAKKQRYLYLPPGESIDTSNMDGWVFPIGTRAWKEFRKDGLLVETRYLEKRGPSNWIEVAYLWNSELTEAYAVPSGVQNAKGTTHDVPSSADCSSCHDGESDVLIGVSAIQLSMEAGGGFLSTLIAESRLSNPPAAEFPVPGDGIVEASLGYLHANCGNCHNSTHFLASKRALRLKLLTTTTTPEESSVYTTAIDAPANHVVDGTSKLVVAGDPAASQLFVRANKRSIDSMPPLGTEQVDTAAMKTLADWISGL
ncbi:MAG: hypothetical protein R3B13_29425 [Polyangiaceae bacterium]